MSKVESYFPYETTAKIIATGEDSNSEFLLSVFKGATPEQIYKFQQFIAGKIHDGIELGLGLSGDISFSEVETYQRGFEDGLQLGLLDKELHQE